MIHNNTDILIFVEDPGAANYIASLPKALKIIGRNTVVLAKGIAKDFLQQRGIHSKEIHNASNADQIINTVKPRLVLVGTSENLDTLGLTLVVKARNVGIPSLGVVDAAMNVERRFCGRSGKSLAYAPDWLMVPDEWTKQAFVSLGFPDKYIEVCGHPHYDFVMEIFAQLVKEDLYNLRQRLFPNDSEDKKIVVFVCEGSVKNEPRTYEELKTYSLVGRGSGVGRTEIVLEEFLDAIACVKPRPYVVLRIHPKDVVDDYDAYKSEVDHVSSGGSPLELIYAADLIVGMTSMLMTEAVLMGKPTLSIVPRVVEKEWLPGVRAGVISCVTTRDELESKLKALLHEKGETLYFPNKHNIFVPNSIKHIVTFLERLLCDNTNRNSLVF